MIRTCRAGRFSDALRSARRSTKDYPEHPVPWTVLATAAAQLGRTDEALKAYENAKRLEPDNPGTRNNHGLLLMQEERFADAIREFSAALRLKPDFFEAKHNIALANERNGHFDNASAHYRSILTRHPESAETYSRLAKVLAVQRRLDEAMECHERAVRAAPDVVGYRINQAEFFAERGYLRTAENVYSTILASWPDCIEAYNNLANLLTQKGRLSDAAQIARDGLAQSPAHPGLLSQHVTILGELGETDQAIESCRDAIASAPREPAGYDSLGNALADAGKFDDAEEAYRQALELDPGNAHARHHLAVLRRPADPKAELDRVRSLLARGHFSPKDTAWLHYAAGKLSVDAGETPEATFNHYRTGARLYRQLFSYSVDSETQHLSVVAKTFTRDRIESLSLHGHHSDKPVFIIGMPRSGTSLVEQILASHPKVYGAGERRDINALVSQWDERAERSFPDWCADPELSPEAISEIGSDYCKSLRTDESSFERVTDKMPGNFVFAGLIASALPNARIIHVRRNPLDTCLSCFCHLFGGPQPFSYDLDELGQYYRAYDTLMAHWRQVIPTAQLIEIDYEDVVSTPKKTTRRLIEHCGLEWDSRCLEFHQTERAVRTLSANQVRQPLYGNAVGRWRKFANQLAPLRSTLGPLATEDRS